MEIIYVSKGALLCIWVGTYLHTYFHAAARYEKKVGPLAKKIDKNQKGVLTVSIFENNWEKFHGTQWRKNNAHDRSIMTPHDIVSLSTFFNAIIRIIQ